MMLSGAGRKVLKHFPRIVSARKARINPWLYLRRAAGALHWNMTTRISDETRARCAAHWDEILDAIRYTGLIAPVLRKVGVSRAVIHAYMDSTPGATAQWNAAKETSGDAFAEQALELALNPSQVVTKDKDGNVLPEPLIIPMDAAHARTAVDTLKWAAKVRNPRQYSDKSSIDLSVKTVDLTAIIRDANARLAAAQAGRIIAGESVRVASDALAIEDLL